MINLEEATYEIIIEHFLEYDIDILHRTIFLNSVTLDHQNEDDGVNGSLSKQFIKNLYILNSISSEPITIVMNLVGGNSVDGFGMYDAVKTSKSPVKIIVYGQASSMGSIILQASNDRVMSANSEMLIHYGTISVDASVRSAITHANHEKKGMKKMEKIYMDKIKVKQPNFDIKVLKSQLREDTILTASECVELGLADRILT